ncbi:MAG TPA: FAD-dependent oxidoreductase [Gammaproteobacteria bacterium]|nr:FAD-dependent oxidoreductase [Gammaproteobacteria bacterium]
MIVIIGSGLAGYVLAQDMRRLDQHINITLVTEDCGRYYLKPPLSSMTRSGKQLDDIIIGQANEMEDKLKITILSLTKVEAIHRTNKNIQLASGSLISYDKLVLAVGSKPLELVCQNQPIQINSLMDYEKASSQLQEAKSVAIIGSGLIGTEFAHDLSAKKTIHWISAAPFPLQGVLPSELGQEHINVIKNQGSFYYHRSVQDIQCEHGQWSVVTKGDVIQSDAVLMAIGLRPRIELAQSADIACNLGVQVDQCGRTSDPDIYALGDCAEISGQWHAYVSPLRVSARAIALTLLGQDSEIVLPAFPVLVKSPLLPTVACVHPDIPKDAKWDISGSKTGKRALCKHKNQLWAFALTGECVTERAELVKKIPAFLSVLKKGFQQTD